MSILITLLILSKLTEPYAKGERKVVNKSVLASKREIPGKPNTNGRLPTGWQWVRLEEVCTIHPGQHILESGYNRNKTGIGYLTGPADFGTLYPTITKWTERPKVCCEPGDVLVTVKGAGVGKANLAPFEKVAIGRQLMAVRPKLRVVDSLYCYYALVTQFARLQADALGSTVPGLGQPYIKALSIPLPPYVEQQRITSILCEQLAARARAAAEAQLQLLANLVKSYLCHSLEILPTKWSAKAKLLRSVGGAGAITGSHSGTVAAGKSFAFALHIRISNRTGRNLLGLT